MGISSLFHNFKTIAIFASITAMIVSAGITQDSPAEICAEEVVPYGNPYNCQEFSANLCPLGTQIYYFSGGTEYECVNTRNRFCEIMTGDARTYADDGKYCASTNFRFGSCSRDDNSFVLPGDANDSNYINRFFGQDYQKFISDVQSFGETIRTARSDTSGNQANGRDLIPNECSGELDGRKRLKIPALVGADNYEEENWNLMGRAIDLGINISRGTSILGSNPDANNRFCSTRNSLLIRDENICYENLPNQTNNQRPCLIVDSSGTERCIKGLDDSDFDRVKSDGLPVVPKIGLVNYSLPSEEVTQDQLDGQCDYKSVSEIDINQEFIFDKNGNLPVRVDPNLSERDAFDVVENLRAVETFVTDNTTMNEPNSTNWLSNLLSDSDNNSIFLEQGEFFDYYVGILRRLNSINSTGSDSFDLRDNNTDVATRDWEILSRLKEQIKIGICETEDSSSDQQLPSIITQNDLGVLNPVSNNDFCKLNALDVFATSSNKGCSTFVELNIYDNEGNLNPTFEYGEKYEQCTSCLYGDTPEIKRLHETSSSIEEDLCRRYGLGEFENGEFEPSAECTALASATEITPNNEPFAVPIAGRVFTDIGCVDTSDTNSTVNSILRIALGLMGGIVIFRLAQGAAMLQSIDPESKEEGKLIMTFALAGLGLLILSVAALNFLGINLLQIDAFQPFG